MIELDKKDRALLRLLQQDARIANSALAEHVNLSDTPCLRRVKRLQQEGVITQYQAIVDRKSVGLSVLVYAFVRLSENSAAAAKQFEEHIFSLENVLSCSVISGSYDYILEVVAEDLEQYEYFLKHKLAINSRVAAVESSIVLKQTFSRRVLPI